MANSTIQAARNRSRVRTFHCSTWSTLARYFRLAARTTNPITTFTRASQPPLLGQPLQVGGKQRQQEERQRQAGGERHHAGQRAYAAAAHRSRQQRAHNGPDAGERGKRERQPHEQRAGDAALLRRLVQPA